MADLSNTMNSPNNEQSEYTMSKEDFERKLLSDGFQLKPDYKICDHQYTHTLFYQGCTCCESEKITSPYSKVFQKKFEDVTSTDISWQKGDYCESCIDGRIGVLFCGGHYNNLRVFQGNKNISDKYENFSINVVDPNELIYADIIDEWYGKTFLYVY